MTKPRARKTPKTSSRKGGPEARAEGMRLLAEGFLASAVAAQLGVNEKTVRDWRDSPDGEAELDAARKAKAASFADAAEKARQVVRENLELAARVLAGQLRHRNPAVRSLAARTLLDRGGVPRTERVESVDAAPDFSGLSQQERDTLRALLTKAGAGKA